MKYSIHLLLLFFILLIQPMHCEVEIPIWKVTATSGCHSYFLGTVHVLKKDYRLPGYLMSVLEKSNKVIFEADMAGLNPWDMVKHCFYTPEDSKSLKDMFKDVEWKKVVKLADKFKIPRKSFRKYKPWYVYIDLSIPKNENSFMPDLTVQKWCINNGKELHYLENVSEQIDLFQRMPEHEIKSVILEMADDIEDTWNKTAEIQKAYYRNDIDKLEELIHGGEFCEKYPVSYLMLFSRRNKKWLPVLQKHISENNSVVVVGIGHLTGPDNVLEALQEKGS